MTTIPIYFSCHSEMCSNPDFRKTIDTYQKLYLTSWNTQPKLVSLHPLVSLQPSHKFSMAVPWAANRNNSFKTAGINKEQNIGRHRPRYRFGRDVYKGSGFFPSPQVLFSIICLCSCTCAAPTCPGLPSTAEHRPIPGALGHPPLHAKQAGPNSWISLPEFWVSWTRKLRVKLLLCSTVSLPCFTAEIKHPYVMAQWFLAQSSMRCVSIHGNQ